MDRQPFATSLAYNVPASITKQWITGLKPNQGYTVNQTPSGNTVQIVISEGGAAQTDSGGVLLFETAVE